jgi:hypothetical protein
MCGCNWPINDRFLREHLLCPRETAGQRLDNLDCMLNRCSLCKDARKLTSEAETTSDGVSVAKVRGALCPDETRDPGAVPGKDALSVHYESYQKVPYITKDGTTKEKKDFVSVTVPFSTFKSRVVEYFPKFIAHHNDAKWHDDDFIAIKNKLPRHHTAFVIDYAENYVHQPRFEHQSKYFSQVGGSIGIAVYGCMLTYVCAHMHVPPPPLPGADRHYPS